MSTFKWTCPHCNETQTVISEKTHAYTMGLLVDSSTAEQLAFQTHSIGCSNPECEKTSVTGKLGYAKYNGARYVFLPGRELLYDQSIYPQGAAKPQPDYIPEPLRTDYYEACLIRELSPKAAATLTRRCLQGMIRDFAKIKKGSLFLEITALKEAVENGDADRSISEESVEAIDHVRGVGNIGAHMEKDIDVIVDVDAGEAQALIELVEMLFDEWYGARERRKQRLAKVSQIADEKQRQLAEQKAAKGESTIPNALSALVAPVTVIGTQGSVKKTDQE